MYRNLFSICFVFAGFIFAQPSFAVSYSASAVVYWDTLNFSGVGITPVSYQQNQSVLALPGGTSNTFNENAWTSNTLIASSPQVGTAVSIADSAVLYTSANVNTSEPGFTQALTVRQGTFTVNTSGYLTASIQYALSQAGVIHPMTPPGTLEGGAFAIFGFQSQISSLNRSLAFLNTLDLSNTSKSGALNVTAFFNAGDSVRFFAHSESSAAVPAPETLLPTLLGLFGLALYYEWTRQTPASGDCKR
jgi:hypothetical protein